MSQRRLGLTLIAHQFIHLSNQVALLFPDFKTICHTSFELHVSGIVDGTESRISTHSEKCAISRSGLTQLNPFIHFIFHPLPNLLIGFGSPGQISAGILADDFPNQGFEAQWNEKPS